MGEGVVALTAANGKILEARPRAESPRSQMKDQTAGAGGQRFRRPVSDPPAGVLRAPRSLLVTSAFI